LECSIDVDCYTDYSCGGNGLCTRDGLCNTTAMAKSGWDCTITNETRCHYNETTFVPICVKCHKDSHCPLQHTCSDFECVEILYDWQIAVPATFGIAIILVGVFMAIYEYTSRQKLLEEAAKYIPLVLTEEETENIE